MSARDGSTPPPGGGRRPQGPPGPALGGSRATRVLDAEDAGVHTPCGPRATRVLEAEDAGVRTPFGPRATRVLDAGDADARRAYERAFFKAFTRASHNRLVRHLWLWDDEAERLATRVPYADQRIYLDQDPNGRLCAALAVNVTLADFQSSAFGFSPPSPVKSCCELLTFFAVYDLRLARRLAFIGACFEDLRARGFHTAYATTAPRPLGTYRRYGAEVLASTEIAGEVRHLLRVRLGPRALRGPVR